MKYFVYMHFNTWIAIIKFGGHHAFKFGIIYRNGDHFGFNYTQTSLKYGAPLHIITLVIENYRPFLSIFYCFWDKNFLRKKWQNQKIWAKFWKIINFSKYGALTYFNPCDHKFVSVLLYLLPVPKSTAKFLEILTTVFWDMVLTSDLPKPVYHLTHVWI